MQKLSEKQKARQTNYFKKVKKIYKSRENSGSKKFENERKDFVLDLISKKSETLKKRSIGFNCKLTITNKNKNLKDYAVN